MKNLSLFCISLLASLALCEFLSRILIPIPEPPPVFVHQKSDNIKLLYKPTPNAENKAYGVLNKINADGLRDRDYLVLKPSGVTRIEFLGDSVVYGYGLNFEDMLPKQLEKAMSGNGRAVEVLNLGVSGYESEQEIEFFKEVGLKYGPDIVIVGYTLNDSRYASWELDLFDSLANDKVFYQYDWYHATLRFLYQHSHLLQVIDKKFRIQKKVKILRSAEPLRSYMNKKNTANKDPETSEYRQLEKRIAADGKRLGTTKKWMKFMMEAVGFQTTDFYSSHWNISQKAFRELKQMSEQYGFKVVIVIFPVMGEMDRYPLNSLHQYLGSEFKRMGFEVIDLEPFAEQMYAQYGKNVIGRDGIHFTALGSQLAAQYISDELLRS